MTTFDDPNRESVGLPPIWTGADTDPTDPVDPGDVEPIPEATDLPGGVASHTIAQIEEWVDEYPHLAADVLAHERARGSSARRTLLDWLEGFVESHDGTDAP